MANRLGRYKVTEAQERVLLNLLKEQATVLGLKEFLANVKATNVKEYNDVVNAYLYNDDPVTRANALRIKGRIEFVDDFLRLIEEVTK